MLIGINGNEANVGHRVGVGQYAFELLTHMSKINPPVGGQKSKIYLSDDPLPDLPSRNSNWSYEVFGPKNKWTLLALQKKLIAEKFRGVAPDIFFTPTHYTPPLMPIPSVISIMDMSFETLPHFFKKSDLLQLKYWTKISVLQAKKIITISQFSKNEICRIYGFSPEKVIVTPLAYDKERFYTKIKDQKSKIKNTLDKYKIHGKYFLFVGTLQPKKNLTRLVEAMAALNDKEIKLVVVGMSTEGRGGWMYEQFFDKIKQLNLSDRIVFTGYVPDDDIPLLMSGSVAHLLPSLYEGFGIPALEAMAVGVPVVVSKVASLPEVCGGGASYIDDPSDVWSIKVALEKVSQMSKTERETRIGLGLEWVKRYNWEQTAKQTLDVLYECIQR